jgi:hypothetical protein
LPENLNNPNGSLFEGPRTPSWTESRDFVFTSGLDEGPLRPPDRSAIQNFFADAIIPSPQTHQNVEHIKREQSYSPFDSMEEGIEVDANWTKPPLLTSKSPSVDADLSSQANLHKCPVENCTKSYRRKGDLKFHVIRKHPNYTALPGLISKPKSDKSGKSYPCPIPWCKCGYKWPRDLQRHIESKHKDEDIPADVNEIKVETSVTFNEKYTAKWMARTPRTSTASKRAEKRPSRPPSNEKD